MYAALQGSHQCALALPDNSHVEASALQLASPAAVGVAAQLSPDAAACAFRDQFPGEVDVTATHTFHVEGLGRLDITGDMPQGEVWSPSPPNPFDSCRAFIFQVVSQLACELWALFWAFNGSTNSVEELGQRMDVCRHFMFALEQGTQVAYHCSTCWLSFRIHISGQHHITVDLSCL